MDLIESTGLVQYGETTRFAWSFVLNLIPSLSIRGGDLGKECRATRQCCEPGHKAQPRRTRVAMEPRAKSADRSVCREFTQTASRDRSRAGARWSETAWHPIDRAGMALIRTGRWRARQEPGRIGDLWYPHCEWSAFPESPTLPHELV